MLSGGDALSSDELYAAAHLAGLAPSPVFGTGWAAEELGVAAAVAVRGLLSRGLATPDGPALTPDARSALDPLLDPRSLLEIRRDEGPGGRRRYVLGESGARRVLATERIPSIWELRDVEGPAEATAWSLAESLIPCASRVAAPAGLTVSGPVLSRAETLLAQGGEAGLVALLGGHGLDGTAAGALATILTSSRVLVTVRTVRLTDPGVREAGAVTWLDAGPAGLWLVTLEETGDDRTYTLAAAGHEDVREALEDLLGTAPAEEPSCPTS
jgi:hypothetical protein